MSSKVAKKQHVHVCVWETPSEDPCVFVARTEKRLYAVVWETVKEHWTNVMGDKVMVPRDPGDAVWAYESGCRAQENDEYLTVTREEVL